jgi:hypothetical protein
LFEKLRQKAQNPRSAATALPVDPALNVDAKRRAELKAEAAGDTARKAAEARGETPVEIGGPKGLEPTRYGDWENSGRCIDF